MLHRTLQLFLLLFLLITNSLVANPIVPPQAYISEFKFEKDGSWVLEINFRYSTLYYRQLFDSIFVASAKSISRIRLEYIQDGTALFVVTSDSLTSPLLFDSNGDCIKLYTYGTQSSRKLVDSVSFGNYPGSIIGELQKGCSISRLNYYLFCKDNSPTIGSLNDTAGTLGILKGSMFDKNNSSVKSGDFRLDNLIVFSETGTYATQVFSRKFICTSIRSASSGQVKYENIDSLNIDIEPDSIGIKNIHFKDFIVGVKRNNDPSNYELKVINYPNPFNSSTNFFVKIPSDLNYKKGSINIYRINGEKIFSIPLSNRSTVTWNARNHKGEIVSSGVYYYQLVLDNAVYTNGSMVFLK